MTLMRFKIGGPGGEHELAFDWAQDITAADVWWLEEMGLSPRTLEEVVEKAQALADGDDRELLAGLGLKALCAVVYIAYRRGGGDKSWTSYAAGIAPATFEILGMETPPANRAERRAAARPAAKRNGKAKNATVGEALADAGAAAVTD